MPTERVDIVINEDGSRTVRKSFEDLGSAARGASTDVNKLEVSLDSLQSSAQQISSTLSTTLPRSVQGLTTQTTTAASSVRQLAGATNQIAGAAGGAVPPITRLGQAAGGAGGGFNNLSGSIFTFRNALRAMVGLFFLRELKEFTDQWISFENNVRLSTSSVAESQTVLQKLYEATMRSRTAMEPMIILYRRAAQAGKELGASQQQLIDFTEGVGKALTVQGISMKQAHGTLLQLGQLIGMARLRAQEFNSINENTPRILQAVADNLAVAGGSIHKLRLALNAGIVTNQQFFQAFMKGVKKINEEFANVRPTFGQAFAVLETGFGMWLYQMNKATGIASVLANAIMWLGNHMKIVMEVAAALGVILALTFGPALLSSIYAATTAAVGFIIGLGPLLSIPLAILGIVAAVTILRDEFVILQDGQVTLGDYMRAVWSDLKHWVAGAIGVLRDYYDWWMENNRKAVNEIIVVLKGLWGVFKQLFNWIIAGWASTFQTIKIIVQGLEDFYKTRDFSVFTRVGTEIKEAFKTAYSTDYIGNFFKAGSDAFAKLTASAKRFADMRKRSEAGADLGKKLGAGIGDLANLDKLRHSLERILNTIDPVEKGYAKLIEAENVLGQAYAKNLITYDEYLKWMEKAKEHYADIIDPIGAYRRELQTSTQFMSMDHDKRQAYIQVQEMEQQLRRKGVIMLDAEREEFRKLAEEQNRQKRISQEIENLENRLILPKKRLQEGLIALNRLYKENRISGEQYTQTLAEMRIAAGQGTWADGLIAKMDILSDKMRNYAARIGEAFGDMINGVIDGIGNAIGRAIAFGENLREALGNAAREILANLISALVKIGLQLALNAIIGESVAAAALASTSAMAAAAAEAWAPAATFASLATVGANSGAAIAGITAAYATTKAIAAIPSFAEGGFTGYVGKREYAGIVHGQEFVVNADATAKYRPLLESMNKGESAPLGVNISVHNYGTSKITVERTSPTDIRIIAREEAVRAVHSETPAVVASNIANPTSRVSQALDRHTLAVRKRS